MEATQTTYLTPAEVCRRFQISLTTLWRLQKARAFVAPRYLPGGQRRYLAADVEKWKKVVAATGVKAE